MSYLTITFSSESNQEVLLPTTTEQGKAVTFEGAPPSPNFLESIRSATYISTEKLEGPPPIPYEMATMSGTYSSEIMGAPPSLNELASFSDIFNSPGTEKGAPPSLAEMETMTGMHSSVSEMEGSPPALDESESILMKTSSKSKTSSTPAK